MPMLVNTQPRLYSIGGVKLSPNVPVQIHDEMMENARLKELMELGFLKVHEGQEPSKEDEEKAAEQQAKQASAPQLSPQEQERLIRERHAPATNTPPPRK